MAVKAKSLNTYLGRLLLDFHITANQSGCGETLHGCLKLTTLLA